MTSRHPLQTNGNEAYDIQPEINDAVTESGVQEGLVTIVAPHTTAALGIISYHDPLGLEDVMDEFQRLVPARITFKHEHDTPQDAAGHVLSTMVGPTLTLIVTGGEVLLGHSQKVFFLEFDGPRRRQFFVKVTADPTPGA
ncbi:YjbQ family protein [Occultella glacieicola]|uniref:YjbQ family protein n=1 Tax=Occultella glacieicola TaxID=2518684 RepID=A0ABY2E4N6_9MICO|nr:secondary thiamine-phosphate synthase enzyme YjbQ [Occultella glacieicola]TDE94999.1 YjbQ family protein [Occultella glacieicola]